MKLIIAEKPSVGRAIAEAVGATMKREGYLEGGGFIVSWCRGHLVDLCPPDAYGEWAGRWDSDKLPMIPSAWKWEVTDGSKGQFEVLAALLRRDDVDEVVNACDADREGEGIFRRVAMQARCSKPVFRLWSTSLVPDQIRKDLAAAKPSSAYDGLAAAAEGRAKADWLVGMNASRAYSVLYGRASVGRVQTPTLSLIAERTRQIAAFKSKPFFQTVLDLGGFEVFGPRLESEEAAAAAAEKALGASARVASVERKRERNAAPRLYDLTGLQRDASTRAGLSADETLAALQGLYEAKLATYPRTESKFIGSADAPLAEKAISLVSDAGVVGEEAAAAFDPSRRTWRGWSTTPRCTATRRFFPRSFAPQRRWQSCRAPSGP